MNIISKINNSFLSVLAVTFLMFSCSDDDAVDIVDIIDDDTNTETEDVLADLALTLANYTDNEIIESGDVDFEFVVTNAGETTIEAGTSVYVSLDINGTQYDIDLLNNGEDAATEIVLEEDLAPGASYTYIPEPISQLNVETTLQLIDVSYAYVCSIVWGTTEESIGTFEADLNSEDNIFCLGLGTVITEIVTNDDDDDEDDDDDDDDSTDSDPDLAITLSDRTNNEVIETGDVDFEFVITNQSTTTLEAGTSIYVSIKFDDTQFDLDLVSIGDDAATELVLEEDLASGESLIHVTSPVDFLNVDATLQFLGVTYVDVCSIVWGTTEDSIGTFDSDSNTEDNTFCLGFGTN